MQTSATNKKLRTLLTGIRDQTLIPNPLFQRRLVWSNAHKVAFLRTVLDGMPFPEIFISAGEVDPDTGDGTELIVDGQQRITTLYQYFTDSPELVLRSGGVPRYRDLDPEAKRAFLEYEVVVRDLGPLGDTETRDVFHRINSTNYSLNAMEVNSSRYDGELKKFAEKISGESFFLNHKIFTGLDGRRMNDIRFGLTLIITVMSGYFNRDDAHEEYLDEYNDEFPASEEIEAGLHQVFKFIDSCGFDAKSRVWQKADLLTLLVELYRILVVEGVNLDRDIVAARMSKFYSDVESVTRKETVDSVTAEYYRRVRSGINDRTSRISRGDIVRAKLLS